MKKIFTLATLLVVALSNAQAPLEKGAVQLNAGFGSSSWGTPVYAGLDYGLGNNFTLGAEVSYRSYEVAFLKSTIIGAQANANYHFNQVLNIPSKWDFYGGLNVNYYYWNIEDKVLGYSDIVGREPFGVGAQVGGRYFFNNKFAINLEGGGGNINSGGKIGITYKF